MASLVVELYIFLIRLYGFLGYLKLSSYNCPSILNISPNSNLLLPSFSRCFVGDEPDQWRKCSDRYFPGNHTLTHSGLNVKPLNPSDKRKPTDSYSSASTSDEYQKPPRPGGLQSLSDFTAARLWPVTYLYSEGPPNSTEFSNFVDCNKETC